MAGRPTRRLIWIPIVHSETDLGNMGERVRDLYVRRMGQARWAQHVAAIDRMWKSIRARVESLNLRYGKVRLYQDGLPACGREAQIVEDLAKAGSANHQLLLNLMKKGAALTGTESPELLLEEYNLAREALGASGQGEGREANGRDDARRKALLDRRDRYIADRVAQTLQPGETGLIFLGLLHSLAGRLPPDIEIIR